MNDVEKTVPEAGREVGGGHEVTRQTDRYAIPPVDIYEDQERLTVLADLPGVTAQGLSVQVEQGILTIEGRVDWDTPGNLLRREFSLLNFYRQFRISEAVDTTKIRATLRNGVLTLELPKAEEAKPRRIPVEA